MPYSYVLPAQLRALDAATVYPARFQVAGCAPLVFADDFEAMEDDPRACTWRDDRRQLTDELAEWRGVVCPNTTPIRRASASRCRAGSSPATRNRPAVGVRIPINILIVVLFPAPFGPR